MFTPRVKQPLTAWTTQRLGGEKMKTLLNKQNSQNNNNSSKLFLQRQVREEQKLSQGLRLKSSVKDKLQVRHSVKTIASFFDTYGDIIAEQHYLYVIPEDDSCITTITTPYPEKPIYTLDSYNYSLYSRDEYKAALQANMSKGNFFFLFLCV